MVSAFSVDLEVCSLGVGFAKLFSVVHQSVETERWLAARGDAGEHDGQRAGTVRVHSTLRRRVPRSTAQLHAPAHRRRSCRPKSGP